MQTDPMKLETTSRHHAFSAFVLSILGWLLLQAWNFQIGAGVRFHAFTALVGLALAGACFLRCRLYWSPSTRAGPITQQPGPFAQMRMVDAGSSIILLAIGIFMAQLARAGWVFPFAVFAVGLTFIPWSKIALCRRHFLASSLIVGLGGACAFLFTGGSSNPVILPIASWILWFIACFLLLRRRQGVAREQTPIRLEQ
jgi:hypothetical protein